MFPHCPICGHEMKEDKKREIFHCPVCRSEFTNYFFLCKYINPPKVWTFYLPMSMKKSN
jgi:ribosomal protein L37AE/L43A